jgi:SAM-dependent methyltransferase
MEEPEYTIMYNMEEDYWWYVGLHRLVLDVVRHRELADRSRSVLDAGCGTGRLITLLRAAGLQTVGIDLAREALRLSAGRDIDDLVQASISEIPCKSEAFDLLVSLDVADCLEPDQARHAFEGMLRVLKPGGRLILNLPAHDFLRSSHDAAQHIVHRYGREELRSILTELGFVPEICTYRNTVLFPLAAILRLWRRGSAGRDTVPQSDLRPLPRSINTVFTWILLAENLLVKRGISLPMGLSVFCVARKPL